jgi:hypothetical protein
MNIKNNSKLPSFFKPIFWSYDFSKIKATEEIERIIINSINYGDWKHWQWLINYYGKKKIREVVEDTPRSEFRKGAFRLILLLLNIKKTKYVSMGVKIKAKKHI